MKKFLLLALVVAATSCATEKRCKRLYPNNQRDSIYINTTTVIRDTTVFYEIINDTVEAAVPILKPSFLSNKYAKSTAYVREDSLYHTLTATGQQLPVEVQIKYVDRIEYRYKVITVNKKYIPIIYRYLLGALLGVVIIITTMLWIKIKAK